MTNTTTKAAWGGPRSLFAYTSRSQSVFDGSQDRNHRRTRIAGSLFLAHSPTPIQLAFSYGPGPLRRKGAAHSRKDLVSHRHDHRSIWSKSFLKHFLNWGSLFPGDSKLCQVDRRNSLAWLVFKDIIWPLSMSWRSRVSAHVTVSYPTSWSIVTLATLEVSKASDSVGIDF